MQANANEWQGHLEATCATTSHSFSATQMMKMEEHQSTKHKVEQMEAFVFIVLCVVIIRDLIVLTNVPICVYLY